MSSNAFRVIVVGGGPVGLTAAHSLSRANLDFVVLERRARIVEDAGSNLVLLPIGLRVLGQLGLLPAIESVSSPMSRFRRIDHDGRDLGDTLWFTYFKENHGAYPRVISRHDLMQTLYDGLPPEAQAKLLPGKKAIAVTSGPDGVSVTCADGTSYTGSVLVGADGAHSRVRDLMRAAALQTPAITENEVNEAEPFVTTYRAMWVRFPTVPPIKAGDASETHGYNCEVVTGVTIVYPILTAPGYGVKSMEERTFVHFAQNSQELIEAYANSGEGVDRAGGFAVQGLGGMLIAKIDGDFHNVVGFPAASFFRYLNLLIEEEDDFLDI